MRRTSMFFAVMAMMVLVGLAAPAFSQVTACGDERVTFTPREKPEFHGAIWGGQLINFGSLKGEVLGYNGTPAPDADNEVCTYVIGLLDNPPDVPSNSSYGWNLFTEECRTPQMRPYIIKGDHERAELALSWFTTNGFPATVREGQVMENRKIGVKVISPFNTWSQFFAISADQLEAENISIFNTLSGNIGLDYVTYGYHRQ